MADQISDIREDIGEIRATAKAAHARLDRTERSISKQLDAIDKKLERLSEHMNKSIGRNAVVYAIAGVIGGAIVKLLMTIKI